METHTASLANSLAILGNLTYLLRNGSVHSQGVVDYLGLIDAEIARMGDVLKLHLPIPDRGYRAN